MDAAIVTEEPEQWLNGEYPKRMGDMKISFGFNSLHFGKVHRGSKGWVLQ